MDRPFNSFLNLSLFHWLRWHHIERQTSMQILRLALQNHFHCVSLKPISVCKPNIRTILGNNCNVDKRCFKPSVCSPSHSLLHFLAPTPLSHKVLKLFFTSARLASLILSFRIFLCSVSRDCVEVIYKPQDTYAFGIT